jgi:large exoprotein involved in heme utilization and adhesion
MHDSITVSGGSQIFSLAFAGGRSGDIRLAAPEITLTDFSAVASATFANAIAGNVVLAGSNLNVLNGAQVVNITFGDGPGGDITVNASSVVIDGNGLIETDTFGSGRGGDITLNLGQGSLNLNFGTIATSGDLGSGGNITINAGSISLLSADLSSPSVINNFTTGTGSSGNISLNVGTLELQGVGTRINNTTFGDSPTGAIRIAASDSISFSGGGIVVTNFGNPTTTGGNIEITAPALTMNGGFITTSHAGPARSGDIVLDVGTVAVTRGAQISSELNGGSGRGGDIRITSDVVSISGPGSVLDSANFSSDPSGLAGDIHVQARQVVLQDGAAISAQSVGTGNAGNINIMASDSLVMQSSSITTETVQSDGGDIHITVGRLVHLLDSRITTSVQGGLGNGGNITIDPQFVILQNSQILAQAFGGNGGNILIVAGVFFADPFSTISASSTLGISGPVDVQAPVTNLSGTLAPLPAESVQATALLQARCAARFQESQFSSFVQAGRDGLPLEPGGLLPSPLYVESPGSTRLAVVPDVPGLRVGRTFMESDLTLAPIAIGCSS